MIRPRFRTGSRGVPRALPAFMYHGEYTRLDASACGVPPGAWATVHVVCRRAGGEPTTCAVDLVRARNGRSFLLCPFCGARRAHLYSFLRRMERPGYRCRVAPHLLACRACHRIQYASQYSNRYRDLSRGGRRFGFNLTADAYRREEREGHRDAVAAERAGVRWRRLCERERARRARAERERRARKRRADARANSTPSITP